MIVRVFHNSFFKVSCHFFRSCQSLSIVKASGDGAQYPPIVDVTSEAAIVRHERQLVYDEIRNLPTVEEKLLEITSRFSRSNTIYCFTSAAERYCGIPFQHYITRTHLIHGFPENFKERNVDSIYEEIKPHLIQVIASQYNNNWHDTKIPESDGSFKVCSRSRKIIFDLITCFSRRLAFENDHLLGAAFDYMPRIASYWWHGGFPSEPIKEIHERYEADELLKDYLRQEVLEKNRIFQYQDFPFYTVRTEKPLLPVVPHDDPLCNFSDIGEYHYDPPCFGLNRVFTKLVNVPGFWPGERCEYPFLCFNTSEMLQNLTKNIDHYDLQEVEDGFGIMSSFGWLMSHSAYLGFTPFHDITYPLVAQSVLTDGQDWNFYMYQLNTICFHEDVDQKDKRNLCWSSGKMRLFESIEDGDLKGINDEVFKVLLKFFLNTPAIPEGVTLKPYVGLRNEEDTKNVREMLKEMYSNRFLKDDWKLEVPTWVQIYKNHKDAVPTPWIKLQ